MKKTEGILWIFVSIILLLLVLGVKSQLSVGFYSSLCPKAESIVKSNVEIYLKDDPSMAAGLLRLHFHDCMVQGCDGSVLIMNKGAEITAGPSVGLRGFEVVDDAKEEIENLCPGVVSCADILALATRDALAMIGGPSWSVASGRRDGLVSESSKAEELPDPSQSIDVHIKKFADKGLTVQDLVTLTGAHTIGKTGCHELSYRLENFTSTGDPDPTINPILLKKLQAVCPLDGEPRTKVELDKNSELKFDNSFYKNLIDGNGILESDQKLWSHPLTKGIVQKYADNLAAFLDEFKKAMVKLSTIDVKTGSQGEIRKLCGQFN